MLHKKCPRDGESSLDIVREEISQGSWNLVPMPESKVLTAASASQEPRPQCWKGLSQLEHMPYCKVTALASLSLVPCDFGDIEWVETQGS